MSCKIPDCSSAVVHSRGVCRACYIYAASLVFHKLTTWDALEAAGCVDHTEGQMQSPRRPVRSEWFARGVGMPPDMMITELRRRSTEYNRIKRGVKAPRG